MNFDPIFVGEEYQRKYEEAQESARTALEEEKNFHQPSDQAKNMFAMFKKKDEPRLHATDDEKTAFGESMLPNYAHTTTATERVGVVLLFLFFHLKIK